MIRLNVAIPPSDSGPGLRSPRRARRASSTASRTAAAWSTTWSDIELRAFACGYGPVVGPLVESFGFCAGNANRTPNNLLGDGVDANERPFLTSFPYLGDAAPGLRARPSRRCAGLARHGGDGRRRSPPPSCSARRGLARRAEEGACRRRSSRRPTRRALGGRHGRLGRSTRHQRARPRRLALTLLGLAYQQRARETATSDPRPLACCAGAPRDAAATELALAALRALSTRLSRARSRSRGARADARARTRRGSSRCVGDALVELGRYREAFAAFDAYGALRKPEPARVRARRVRARAARTTAAARSRR